MEKLPSVMFTVSKLLKREFHSLRAFLENGVNWTRRPLHTLLETRCTG